MTFDEAVRLLMRLREAAPPTTARKLNEVISFIESISIAPSAVVSAAPSGPSWDSDSVFARTREQLANLISQIEAQTASLHAGRLGRVTTEQADALRLVMDYAGSGLALLELTLQMNQLQAGTFPLDILVFNPLDAAAEAWQRTASHADARGHQFNVLADHPLPDARGDYQQTVAILMALVDNAIRYMPYGGEIRLTINTLGTHLLYNVADTGIGLTAEDHEHIATPYWRGVHHPLVRQHHGSGLRLYVARQILERMGGELFFSGEPSVGSTFSFTLPADA